MSLTDTLQFQMDTYGKILDGTETSLEIAKLERRQYLKQKFRPNLAAAIGDYGDNITDTARAIILGQAIALGIVTDTVVISSYSDYIQAMLEGYGGAKACMATIAQTADGLYSQLVAGYYVVCQQIAAAGTEDEVRSIDLPGEPKIGDLSVNP
jgi:hypothetical protein